MTTPTKQQQAENAIRQWIDNGKYTTGDKLPTIVDMAEKLKLKTQPVRQAIKKLAAAGLLKTVNGVGVFIASPEDSAGKIMVLSNNPAIFEESDLTPEKFINWEIYQGVVDAARKNSLETVICLADDYRENPGILKEKYEREKCCGVISLAMLSNKIWRALLAVAGPGEIVNASYGVFEPGPNNVRVSIKPGFRTILDKAYELGHRRFGFVYGYNADVQWSHMERYRIFMEFCREKSIFMEPGKMISSGGTTMDGYRAALELLKNDSPPSVIIAVTDLRAQGVIQAVKDQGLTVGKDISVAGYDDLPLAAELGLTTVRTPRREIGETAVKMLLRKPGEQETVWVDTVPVFRESLANA